MALNFSTQFGEFLGSKRWQTTAIDHAQNAGRATYANLKSSGDHVDVFVAATDTRERCEHMRVAPDSEVVARRCEEIDHLSVAEPGLVLCSSRNDVARAADPLFAIEARIGFTPESGWVSWGDWLGTGRRRGIGGLSERPGFSCGTLN